MILLLVGCRAAPEPSDPEPCDPVTWYRDADGDGYGTDLGPTTRCRQPDGWVEQAGDCDDLEPAISPGASESCNGTDDDCDGRIDPDGATGCTDQWADADGDGLGSGDPTCACEVTAVTIGGDCDDTDIDRQADCTEGTSATAEGIRIAADGGYWSLLGAVEDALAVVSTDETVALLSIPAADTPQSAVTLSTVSTPTWSRPILGDLDGDGLIDVVSATGTNGGYDDLYTLTPTLSATFGPLPGSTWSATLDPLQSMDAYESLFVADLDGDGAPEGWYTLGSGPGGLGQFGAWRIDGDSVTRFAFDSVSEIGRRTYVTAVGDLDGDGFTDLGSYSDGAISIHPGPLSEFPDERDAAATLTLTTLDDLTTDDLDDDGVDDLVVVDTRAYVVTQVTSGALADVATARIDPENDTVDESALHVATGDRHADGTRDLIVSDTVWPWRAGAGNMYGALYVFTTLPTGAVDVRSADERIYGEEYGLFGAFPTVLEDGRIAVGAPVEVTDVGTGVVWVLD